MANLSLGQIANLCKVADWLESDSDGKAAKIEFHLTGASARAVAQYLRDSIRADEKETRELWRRICAAAKLDPKLARLVKKIQRTVKPQKDSAKWQIYRRLARTVKSTGDKTERSKSK